MAEGERRGKRRLQRGRQEALRASWRGQRERTPPGPEAQEPSERPWWRRVFVAGYVQYCPGGRLHFTAYSPKCLEQEFSKVDLMRAVFGASAAIFCVPFALKSTRE